MNINNLNHPFFIYPRGFMSEYNNYNLYRKEVVKLYKFIDKLQLQIELKHNDNDILIPLIIGSSMEDSLIKFNTSIENIFQFRQLFPNYINNFIKSNLNKKFIQIIIISPDNFFSDQSYRPFFTLYETFDFVLTNSNEYVYQNELIEIKINIFNCPVPCTETRNKLICKYDSIITGLETNPYDISSYTQTQIDLEFINNFYIKIDKLFNMSTNYFNVTIIINSWVNFKNLDGYSEKYNMFPKILKLANQYNIIATEWDFIDELFYTKIISNYNFGNKNYNGININYVFNEYLTDLPQNLIDINFKDLYIIDFNSEHCLKKLIL